MCEWFHQCVNKPTAKREHPTLGMVPICDSCEAWRERTGVVGDVPPLVAKSMHKFDDLFKEEE